MKHQFLHNLLIFSVLFVMGSNGFSQSNGSRSPDDSGTGEQAQKALEREKAKLEEERRQFQADREAFNDAIKASRTSVENIAAALVTNGPALVSLEVQTNSGDAFKELEGAISQMAGTPDSPDSPNFFSNIFENKDTQKYSGNFLVIVKSISNFRDFQNYVQQRAAQVTVILHPVEQYLMRTSLKISFNTLVGLEDETKVFWIGDSSLFRLPEKIKALNLRDIQSFVPYLSGCTVLTVDCMKTLVSKGYLSQQTWIDRSYQMPLVYLKSALGQAAWLRDVDNSHQILSSRSLDRLRQPLMTKLTLVNTLWFFSSDMQHFNDLRRMSRDIKSSLVQTFPHGALYVTPLSFSATTANLTNNPRVDFTTAINQFLNYICTIQLCSP